MPAQQQGLAVSVRAPAKLFLGFLPAEADFSCFCAEITRHTNVPLLGSLPSSQLSCSGIPLNMMLVGPEEGISPRQASVLTAICPSARRHPSQMWITKETCLSHWQIGNHSMWLLLPGSVCVWSRRGRVVSLLLPHWHLVVVMSIPLDLRQRPRHPPPEDSFNWPETRPPWHPVSFP